MKRKNIGREQLRDSSSNSSSSRSRASFWRVPCHKQFDKNLSLSRLYYIFSSSSSYFFQGDVVVSHLHISRCHQLSKETLLYIHFVYCCTTWLRISTTPSGSSNHPMRLSGRNKQINSITWRACSVMDRWATPAATTVDRVDVYLYSFFWLIFFFFMYSLH